MDNSQTQARDGATAMVSRGFEPVRIERHLLARVFDLVCEIDAQAIGSTQEVTGHSTVDLTAEQRDSSDIEGRRAA